MGKANTCSLRVLVRVGNPVSEEKASTNSLGGNLLLQNSRVRMRHQHRYKEHICRGKQAVSQIQSAIIRIIEPEPEPESSMISAFEQFLTLNQYNLLADAGWAALARLAPPLRPLLSSQGTPFVRLLPSALAAAAW